MQIVKTKQELREWVSQNRAAGEKINLVPTMGFLHEGHFSLIRKAKESGAKVVVSVFVNPIQFCARLRYRPLFDRPFLWLVSHCQLSLRIVLLRHEAFCHKLQHRQFPLDRGLIYCHPQQQFDDYERRLSVALCNAACNVGGSVGAQSCH